MTQDECDHGRRMLPIPRYTAMRIPGKSAEIEISLVELRLNGSEVWVAVLFSGPRDLGTKVHLQLLNEKSDVPFQLVCMGWRKLAEYLRLFHEQDGVQYAARPIIDKDAQTRWVGFDIPAMLSAIDLAGDDGEPEAPAFVFL